MNPTLPLMPYPIMHKIQCEIYLQPSQCCSFPGSFEINDFITSTRQPSFVRDHPVGHKTELLAATAVLQLANTSSDDNMLLLPSMDDT